MTYAPAVLGDKIWTPWKTDLDRYRGPDPASVLYGTAATRGATNTTLSVTAPAGTKVGDLLILFASTYGDLSAATSFTSSLGTWTTITVTSAGGYPYSEGGAWFRHATASDVAGTADVLPVAVFSSLAYAASALIATVPGRNWVPAKGSGYSSQAAGYATGTISPQAQSAQTTYYNGASVEVRDSLLFSMAHFGAPNASDISISGTGPGDWVERAQVIHPNANMLISTPSVNTRSQDANKTAQWSFTWGGGTYYWGFLWFVVVDRQGSHYPAWASGSGSMPPPWTEISSSAPFTTSKVETELLLDSAGLAMATNPPFAYQIEIGVGPAGSEVLVGSMVVGKHVVVGSAGAMTPVIRESFEAYIKKNQRVAIRTALTPTLAVGDSSQNSPGSVSYTGGSSTGLRLRMIG